ncbi:hypothetical protein C7C46_21125 [Streptomyces tateyamensis]|uniref:Toxin n=1 Tax=Streptomyces tateyamensis TaxID=565073 RepID=A0A2V4NCM6_9ACTN|nr:hypothetical protein [Streptomyces tateyamensis]PYC76895.1 hypothetical protein C7C46_21125 [Streptomyces tateyamensis]
MRWRKRPRSELTALVERIAVPRPFQLAEFCAGVAAERGRPLRLVPLANAAGRDLPCGLWLGLDEVDLVFYEAGAAPILKTQIVLHEISHMLLDHTAPEAATPAERAEPAARALADRAATDAELGLRTDRVLALLARSGYSSRQEADAESLATLLLERATRAGADAPAGQVLARLDDAFGHPVRRS